MSGLSWPEPGSTGWNTLVESNVNTLSGRVDNTDATVGALVPNTASATGAALLAKYPPRNSLYFFVDDPTYGAVGDGITDDTTAIKAAISAATAASSTHRRAIVKFTPGKSYLVTPGQIVFAGCGVDGRGAEILVTSNAAGAAVQLGSDTITTPDVLYWLPDIRYNGSLFHSSWPAGSIGLRVVGIVTSEIHVAPINGFETNLNVTCNSGAQTSYNSFYLRKLINGKLNCLVDGGPTGNTGWTTECVYFAGQMGQDSAYGTNVAGCHHIALMDTGTTQPGSHKFYGQSLEVASTQAKQNIYCQSTGNLFDWQRFEGVTPGIVFDGANAKDNLLRTAYNISVTNTNAAYAARNKIQMAHVYTNPEPEITGQQVVLRGGWAFANGVANQKIDVTWTPDATHSFSGVVEVEITGAYTSNNLQGRLRKVFSFNLKNNAGSPGIITQVSRIAEAQGTLPDNVAISDFTWDATNSLYKVQIVNRGTLGNDLSVIVRAVSGVAYDTALAAMPNWALGTVYTTDAATFPRPVVQHLGSQVFGTGVLATSATDGFIYIPTCAGTPTGTPTAQTGTVPLVFDTTGAKLWAYTGGAWKSVAVT